jgi:hypothetical protein
VPGHHDDALLRGNVRAAKRLLLFLLTAAGIAFAFIYPTVMEGRRSTALDQLKTFAQMRRAFVAAARPTTVITGAARPCSPCENSPSKAQTRLSGRRSPS